MNAIIDNANEAIKSYFQTGGNILASRDAARLSVNGEFPKMGHTLRITGAEMKM